MLTFFHLFAHVRTHLIGVFSWGNQFQVIHFSILFLGRHLPWLGEGTGFRTRLYRP